MGNISCGSPRPPSIDGSPGYTRIVQVLNNDVPQKPPDAAEATHADEDAAIALFRLLEVHPEYSQRQLARELGVSLGKTHYLLKALLEKGWVKAQNFRRSSRKLGYLYVLTPRGISHRMRLTQTFLARKEKEFVLLQSQITALRKDLAEQTSIRS